MKIVRLFGGAAALCAFVTGAVLYARVPARSFDLQDSQTVVNRPAADITDTYFFPSPTNPNDVVAVIYVEPFINPANVNTTFFDQGVLYTMKFDNQFGNTGIPLGSKPTEQLVLQLSFGAPSGTTGQQTQEVFVYGPAAPVEVGTTTMLVNSGSPAATGNVNKSFALNDGILVFAGVRRNPAFMSGTVSGTQPQGTPGTYFGIFPGENPYTLNGQSCLRSGSGTCPQGFLAPGPDLFAGSDVLSIVAEFPKTIVAGSGNGVVAYWATTSTETGQ